MSDALHTRCKQYQFVCKEQRIGCEASNNDLENLLQLMAGVMKSNIQRNAAGTRYVLMKTSQYTENVSKPKGVIELQGNIWLRHILIDRSTVILLIVNYSIFLFLSFLTALGLPEISLLPVQTLTWCLHKFSKYGKVTSIKCNHYCHWLLGCDHLLRVLNLVKLSVCLNKTWGFWHRRTGRHFTGGAQKICPENNNLP